VSEILLSDYLQKIEKLLEDSRLKEAAAHARHLLEQRPRYIDAYRLLGKILLEQHQYDDASDIFQRTLSADPEDFVAYVGLAISCKERELLPEAIWYMERAFEIDRHNAAVQHELKELYAKRDGRAPERLPLTAGALARLHFRGQLYQQAVGELRPVLSAAQDRPDLELLFVEALWRDRQYIDAGQAAQNLLTHLPDCIKANAILADIWAANGRFDEAQPYIERLQELVLYDQSRVGEDTAVARAFAHNLIPLPAQTLLEELEYIPQFEAADEEEGLDWVQALEMDESGAENGLGADDWLSAFDGFGDQESGDGQAADPFAFADDPFAAGNDPFVATTRSPPATTRSPPATTRSPPATTRSPPATTRPISIGCVKWLWAARLKTIPLPTLAAATLATPTTLPPTTLISLSKWLTRRPLPKARMMILR
jgi:tetratricopeptide (TPR) repeat protein